MYLYLYMPTLPILPPMRPASQKELPTPALDNKAYETKQPLIFSLSKEVSSFSALSIYILHVRDEKRTFFCTFHCYCYYLKTGGREKILSRDFKN